MTTFQDENGREWVATVQEEATARHHGRWYLVLRPQDGSGEDVPVPEVRWQTAQSGQRTLKTMAEFELRKRLIGARSRIGAARP